jgi:hypothetical protein
MFKKEGTILLNISIDLVFNQTMELNKNKTISQFKNIMLHNLKLLPMNYLIEYKDRDYSNYETFKLGELFFGKSEIDINLKSLDVYVKGIIQ